ncbi:hypothetical protein FHX37_3841 [Haloactinospora alba]|uniref:YCII-related domain-containing protein n=1 Tax=Haloactinospora alba TaxID=405555 RepID=A0A543N9I8_9ACTN|nr:YciI family protein [Haloactinospora alba]TQN28496.1 hypothetical protein FHX37_3841 [Haloactinospora alba]
MRFMMMIKGDASTEAGVMPTQQELDAMTAYNEELVRAGVMLSGEGLHPTSAGARVRFSDGQATVVDGPFSEAKEVVAGFWLLEVASRSEALEWARRCPVGGEGEIEVRQVFEASDFGEEFTPELREREESQRARIADQH